MQVKSRGIMAGTESSSESTSKPIIRKDVRKLIFCLNLTLSESFYIIFISLWSNKVQHPEWRRFRYHKWTFRSNLQGKGKLNLLFRFSLLLDLLLHFLSAPSWRFKFTTYAQSCIPWEQAFPLRPTFKIWKLASCVN